MNITTEQPEALRSLYEITGNVADANTVLINRGELRRLHAEVERITAIADDLQALCDRQALRIAALEQPQIQYGGIPPNWKMVPVEPNEAMHRAAVRTVVHCTGNDDFPPAVYRAMLAAAPQPPAAQRCTAAPNAMSSQVIDALTSYCNTGEIDGADDLLAELLFERDHPPAVEQPQGGQEPDWQDLYRKEKRRAEMWIAKYEKDIGKLQVAVPVAAQPQVEQEPVAVVSIVIDGSRTTIDTDWNDRLAELPAGTHNLYTRPHPPRQPLTDDQIARALRPFYSSDQAAAMGLPDDICTARAIERAHGIGS